MKTVCKVKVPEKDSRKEERQVWRVQVSGKGRGPAIQEGPGIGGPVARIKKVPDRFEGVPARVSGSQRVPGKQGRVSRVWVWGLGFRV